MSLTTHFDEDVIELYSLGRLSEADAATLEEHLLTCQTCQERLERSDDFVRAFRMAVQTSPPAQSRQAIRPNPWRWLLSGGWRPLPLAGAVLIAALAIVVMAPKGPVDSRPIDVRLSALRGSGSGVIAAVPPRHLLRLELDAKALGAVAYRVELADSRGRELWKSEDPVPVVNEVIHAIVARPLPEGLYWVRLYDPSTGQLAREYGLRAR